MTNILEFCALSEAEYEKISEVMRRDEELNRDELECLKTLEKEINRLRQTSELSMSNADEVHFCHLCRQMCGLFVNQAQECPTCQRKVCKFCRRDDGYDLGLLSPMQLESIRKRKYGAMWSCILCYKLKEYRVCSREWIMDGHCGKQNSKENSNNYELKMNNLRQSLSVDNTETVNVSCSVVDNIDPISQDKLKELPDLELSNIVHKERSNNFSGDVSTHDLKQDINNNFFKSDDDSNDCMDIIKVHERHSCTENSLPHEVSSLTLFIQDSSINKLELNSARTIKVRSTRSHAPFDDLPPTNDYLSSEHLSSFASIQEGSTTKSVLIKKLSSLPNVPKPNSIRLLSVSSHQTLSNTAELKNSGYNIGEDLADIRSSIISASQIPSGVRHLPNEETRGDFDIQTRYSNESTMGDERKNPGKTNHEQGSESVENDENFDFFYGGEGTLLVPISNSSEKLDSMAYGLTEKKTTRATGVISRMELKNRYMFSEMEDATCCDNPTYFTGIVVNSSLENRLDSNPKMQHYYLNGVRKTYEKRFPIEDGWILVDQENQIGMLDNVVSKNVETRTDTFGTQEKSFKNILRNDTFYSMEDVSAKENELPINKESSDESSPFQDQITDIKDIKDEIKTAISLNDIDEKIVDNESLESVNMTISYKSNKIGSNELQVTETTKDAPRSGNEVELSEEELRNFLETINKQIGKSVEKHEQEREELLTQQQIRLDIYVKELNSYIQQSYESENQLPGLDEEEWIVEVEQIQDKEVRDLLQEQKSELEELENVKRSILEHLGKIDQIQKEDDVHENDINMKENTNIPFEVEQECNDLIKSSENQFEASAVDEFVRDSYSNESFNETTGDETNKFRNTETNGNVDAGGNKSTFSPESKIQIHDVEKFADSLSDVVLNEVRGEGNHINELRKIDNGIEEVYKDIHSEMKDSEDSHVYSSVAIKPKDLLILELNIDNNSNKIKTFFNGGEEFDEVSKSTTTFGDEISTITTTVYKKDNDVDDSAELINAIAINSGRLLNDNDSDLVITENKNGQVDEVSEQESFKDTSLEMDQRDSTTTFSAEDVKTMGEVQSSSESPQLTSEGEINRLTQQMEGLYSSKMAGEIRFGLLYDDKAKTLEIHVHQCKDIVSLGRSNPYVKTYLMPDKTKKGKRKTYPRKNTDSPKFNEILKYNISRNELESRILSLTIWHFTVLGKNDLLGEVVLPLNNVDLNNAEGHWYSIHQGIGSQRWKSILDLNHDCTVELSLMFSTKDKSPKNSSDIGDLRVMIIRAKSLTSFRENGSCDAFVECFLQNPLSVDVKAKSSTIKSTRNPEWNKEFSFANLTREQLKSSKLEVTVWTDEGFQEKEFLGGVKFFSDKDISNPEVELWENVLNSPNEKFSAIISLRSTMDEMLLD